MMRHLRVARKLARDESIPRWVRALMLVGVLPIPGPIDDLALVVALVILVTFYRESIRAQYAYERSMVEIVPLDTWGAWA